MRLLSRTEEIVLSAVWKLQENAYGVTISDYINRRTGLQWKFGAIYSPLGRLVDNGLLRTIEGEPTAERGGRRKIFYELTNTGKRALMDVQKVHDSVWLDMPSLQTE